MSRCFGGIFQACRGIVFAWKMYRVWCPGVAEALFLDSRVRGEQLSTSNWWMNASAVVFVSFNRWRGQRIRRLI